MSSTNSTCDELDAFKQQQADQNLQIQINNTSTPSMNNVSKLTSEQEQEAKLRSKYPNPQKPNGSSFVQKMLHKGNRKYFDSGDYNMAKSTIVRSVKIVNTIDGQTQQVDSSISMSNSSNEPMNSSYLSINNDSMNNSQQNNSSSLIPVLMNDQNQPNNLILSTLNVIPSDLVNHLNTIYSSPILLNTPTSHTINNKLLGEIGYGIPTPECLQSRKLSISQSKLAIPRLSTTSNN